MVIYFPLKRSSSVEKLLCEIGAMWNLLFYLLNLLENSDIKFLLQPKIDVGPLELDFQRTSLKST